MKREELLSSIRAKSPIGICLEDDLKVRFRRSDSVWGQIY